MRTLEQVIEELPADEQVVYAQLHRYDRNGQISRTVEGGTTYPWSGKGWTWAREEGKIVVISSDGRRYRTEYAGQGRDYDPSFLHTMQPRMILIR